MVSYVIAGCASLPTCQDMVQEWATAHGGKTNVFMEITPEGEGAVFLAPRPDMKNIDFLCLDLIPVEHANPTNFCNVPRDMDECRCTEQGATVRCGTGSAAATPPETKGT